MVDIKCPKLKHIVTRTVIDVHKNPFTVGRGINTDFTIPNSVISRTHCQLENIDDVWYLKDMSTNGSYLNGKLIKGQICPIQHKDVIGLSDDNLFNYMFQYSSLEISDEQLCHIVDSVLNEVETLKGANQAIAQTNEAVTNNQDETQKSSINQYEEMENEMICSICSEMFIKAVTLNCSHTFCKYCIETWKNNKSICPICRAKITTVNATLVLDNVIEKVIQNSAEDIKEHRKRIIEERQKLEESTKPKKSTVKVERAVSRNNYEPNVTPVVEVSSDSDTEMSTDSEYDDDDDRFDAGVPGAYFGGYGSCFVCGRMGHWANGCPYR